LLVGVALVVVLARDLLHHSVDVEELAGVDDAADACLPYGIGCLVSLACAFSAMS
jgi:hypothetical protein